MVVPVRKLSPRARSDLGEGEVGLGLLDGRLGLVERGLEGTRVDREERIVLLHELAVGEVDRLQVPRNARAHLDVVEGDEAADILVVLGDKLLYRL